MNYQNLIFDLDGTLWDSTVTIAKAWNGALKSLGYTREITSQDIKDIAGLAFADIFARKFSELDPDEQLHVGETISEYEHRYTREHGGQLYEGVKEGLQQLQSDYGLFLVSNCQVDYLEIFLTLSGTEDLFIDTECHGGTGLPKSENLKLICQRNNLQDAVYIGDTTMDAEAADGAGLPFIQMTYGYGNFESEVRFDSFAALVKALQS